MDNIIQRFSKKYARSHLIPGIIFTIIFLPLFLSALFYYFPLKKNKNLHELTEYQNSSFHKVFSGYSNLTVPKDNLVESNLFPSVRDQFVVLKTDDGEYIALAKYGKHTDYEKMKGNLTFAVRPLSKGYTNYYQDELISMLGQAGYSTADAGEIAYQTKFFEVRRMEFESYVIVALPAFLLLLFVFRMIKGIRGFTGDTPIMKDLEVVAQTDGGEQVVIDSLENDQTLYENKNIRYNRKYLLFYLANASGLVRTDDMVWMYLRTTTHYYNGIRTNKTHALHIYTQQRKKPIIMMVKKQEDADSILLLTHEHIPGVVMGFRKELEVQWRKDREGFIDSWRANKSAVN